MYALNLKFHATSQDVLFPTMEEAMAALDALKPKMGSPYSTNSLRALESAKQDGTPITVHDRGALTGKLYAMAEGSNGTISARIRPRIGTSYIPCTVEPTAVRELRGFLTEAVRVQGRGIWERSSSGSWACKSFHIVQVHGVKDASLREAINQLRVIDADWQDDPLGHWMDEQDGAA